MKRRLLMIAYKFPPMHSTSCVRTWGFHQHIKKYFDEVLVISTSNRWRLPADPRDLSDVEVFDAKTYDYRTAFQSSRSKQATISESAKTSALGRLAQQLGASFPSLYIFGEGGIRYIESGVSLGKRLVRERGITHVFSTFPPYADHIIASRLKKMYPSLYWIADFRDLHIDPTQSNLLLKSYQRKVNHDMVGKADLVTTVSEGLREHLLQFNGNVVVLRNGIPEMPGSDTPKLFDKFTITYTGSMFQDKRRPDVLLEALAQLVQSDKVALDNIRLCYAGKDGAVWSPKVRQWGLEDCFEDKGMISRSAAVELQQRSHINILLTYSSPDLKGNLTGKVYEYLASQRPLITLVNGPSDTELEELLEDELSIVAYSNEVEKVKKFILDQYRNYLEGKSSDYTRDLKPHLWETLVQGLVEEQLLDPKQLASN